MVCVVGLLLVWYFVAFGYGVGSFIIRSFFLSGVAVVIWSANHIAKKKIEKVSNLENLLN